MSSSLDSMDLAALLATRLCHDLAGPVGAVNTGAELLEEELSAPDPETLGLIADSAKKSAAKLKFLRLAFGSMAGKSVGAAEGLSSLTQFLQASGKTLTITRQPSGLTPAQVQIVLNACLFAADAWPLAPGVTATLPTTESRVMIVIPDKPGLPSEAMRESLEDALNACALPPTPRTIQAHWLGRLAAREGVTILCSEEDLRAEFPPFIA